MQRICKHAKEKEILGFFHKLEDSGIEGESKTFSYLT